MYVCIYVYMYVYKLINNPKCQYLLSDYDYKINTIHDYGNKWSPEILSQS